MNVMPVWMQVYLSGVRWGVVCGVLFGWLCAGVIGIGIDGAPSLLSALVGFAFIGVLYGTIPGAIFGLCVGTVVGVAAGLILQLMLRRVGRTWALFTTASAVIGLQVCAIGALAFGDATAALYLALPAIQVVPLIRTLHRVAWDSAEPAISARRHDTFAA